MEHPWMARGKLNNFWLLYASGDKKHPQYRSQSSIILVPGVWPSISVPSHWTRLLLRLNTTSILLFPVINVRIYASTQVLRSWTSNAVRLDIDLEQMILIAQVPVYMSRTLPFKSTTPWCKSGNHSRHVHYLDPRRLEYKYQRLHPQYTRTYREVIIWWMMCIWQKSWKTWRDIIDLNPVRLMRLLFCFSH